MDNWIPEDLQLILKEYFTFLHFQAVCISCIFLHERLNVLWNGNVSWNLGLIFKLEVLHFIATNRFVLFISLVVLKVFDN